ncbi:tRNA dihydrouridine synthase [Deferribacter thermophilus]|uniref:tRNA dihydrouridine synthase n=1 Tax=Deferribacter thermophilus TaxID=53573 RepID=UPI003C300E15
MLDQISTKDYIIDVIKRYKMVGAPLAGITTPPFRQIIRIFFDGLIFTEMVSVEGIKRKIKSTLEYTKIYDFDRPIFIQLFGNNPESFYEAIKVCEEIASPDGYDLNAGCPVKKVIKSNAGSYLLKDLNNLKEIIKKMRKATNKPISVKTRLGWDNNSLVYKEILKICENEGVDILTMHARTKTEMFSGNIHYEALSELATLRKNITLIGNGNVIDRNSFERLLSTGVDAVMIGRGMMKSPWIFKAIKENISTHEYLSLSEKIDLIYKLLNLEKNYRNNYLDIVKKYIVWFLKGYKGSTELRKKIYQSNDENKMIKLLEEFVEQNS